MKKLLRVIVGNTIKPFLEYYYLKFSRDYHYLGINLVVKEGVFHPGLFFSSKFLAGFIARFDLEHKTLLDMGTGSGLLSLVAAREGAQVTSVDINKQSLINTAENAKRNDLQITLIQSDLFDQVAGQFDYILVNPPYYPRNPRELSEYAWYCGEQHEYFERFFTQLSEHIKPTSRILMVLSEGCDLEKIMQIALNYNYIMQTVSEKNMIIEQDYIFQIMAGNIL